MTAGDFGSIPSPIRERLLDLHGAAEFQGVLAAAEADELAERLKVPVPRLMSLLLPAAAAFARAPVSAFLVGAIARGSTTGNLYYGANLEIEGESLSFALHAEQSCFANAWMAGEKGIEVIAVTAAPCGHCRQFLNEISTAETLSIEMPAGSRSLSELLPDAFGPRDLSSPTSLMQHESHALNADADDDVARAALEAARRSYAPYSRSYAGVALQTKSGRIVAGAYAENAAFNPSLAPALAALSQLNLAGESFLEISDAVLAHVDGRHLSETRAILAGAGVALRPVPARNSA